jgi:tetratricopeptide (TPR) repeat protein
VGLIAAGVVAILLTLALVHRHRPAIPPDTQYSAPPEETRIAAPPETPAPAPNLSNPQTNLPSPQSNSAQIVVQTSPTAQVYLDDAFKGEANHQGRLVIEDAKPGEHSVRVSLQGKKDYEQGAMVAAGQVTEIIAMLANAEQASLPAPVTTPRPRVSVPQPATVDPGLVSQQMETRQHTARAAELLRNKQYADAASEYRAAIQLDPQNADLHVSLGMTLGQQGDWAGQAAEDREAVRLNPSNDRAHLSLGMALSRQNDREGAMAEYREAIRLNPANEGAHVSLGIQFSQMGDWDGAIAEYTEVVRLNPGYYAAHYSLGMAYERKGDRQAALQEYRTASELNPNIPTYKQAYYRLSQQINR